MRKWLQIQRPGWALRKLPLALAVFGVGAAAFCWGRWGTGSRAEAQTPFPLQGNVATMPATSSTKTSDYSNRVVASMYNGSVAVTREELGEYLIARFGAERLEFVVNRKIVEMECGAKGITVDDTEVRVQLANDLAAFGNIPEKDFVNQILKRFNKTLYEWKEDVIRPKLMIAKLVRPTITVTDAELKQSFEARYGPKVECRMIVLAADNKDWAGVWKRAAENRAAFLEEAKKQFLPALAARGGEVPPIHKHFGDPRLEQVAFSLKVGEVSGVVQLPDNTRCILLCERHLPPDVKARFEEERMKMLQEVTELKLAQRIPEVVKALRDRADPQLYLTANGQSPTAMSLPAAPTGVVPATGASPAPR
jgi:hypothetical protein